MSLYGNLNHIMDSITARGEKINMTREDMKELLKLYLNKTVISPFANAKNPLHFIEAFPRNGLQSPRKLPRFSSSEQHRRSEQSAAVRDMMVEHLIESSMRLAPYVKKHGDGYSRDVQRLFRSPIPGTHLSEKEQAKIKADNEEVAFLFNNKTNWKPQAQMQAKILAYDTLKADAFRKKYGLAADQPLTDEVIFQAYARRRGEIITEHYRESVEIAKNAEQAFDPSLSPQELAVNFWKIKEASHFLAEFNLMIGAAENPELPKVFTNAEREEFGDASRYENFAGVAISRFNLIANPMYSILDIDAMEDYDFGSISNKFESLYDNPNLDGNQTVPIPVYNAKKLEQDVIDEFIAKHSDKYSLEELYYFFDNPTQDAEGNWSINSLAVGHLHSDFNNYIDDFVFYYQNKIMPIADKADEYLKLFGLPVRYSSRYAHQPGFVSFYGEQNTSDSLQFTAATNEQKSNELLAQGIPVAYQMNGRTIILSKKTDGKASTDNLTYEKPEALFNAGLEHQQQSFSSQLDAADSMFVRSSPEFKAMKSSLKDISKMDKLKPGEDVTEAAVRFQKLLEDTEKYLIYKKDADMLKAVGQGEEPVNDDDRSGYEQERLDTARKIHAFAQAKLKELDLISQARVTLKDFTREWKGVRIPMDEQTRNHLIARSDIPVQLNKLIKDALAQEKADAEAREAARIQKEAEEKTQREAAIKAEFAAPRDEAEQPAENAEEEPVKEIQPAVEPTEVQEDAEDVPAQEHPEENLNQDDDDSEWELTDDLLNMDSKQLDSELRDIINSDPSINDLQLEFDDEDDLNNPLNTEKALAEVDSQYNHPDVSVASFAQTHIANAVKSHRNSEENFSPEECRFVLSSALLYHALCREADEHTAEADGSLTDMLKHHPDIFTTLNSNLMQSTTINAYLKGVDGIPISPLVMDVLLKQIQNTPLNSVDLSTNVLTAEECTRMLTDELLADMLCQERAADQIARPGALETMLSSDREHAELIADCIKRSDTMKEMISTVSVDGLVSFPAVSALLKQIKEPNFLSEKSFFETYDMNKLMSELMFDRVTALKNDENNPRQSLGKQMADLSYMHRSNILLELQYSSLMDTMAENAGLKDEGMNNRKYMHSLNDLTKLLNQIPSTDTILNTPVLSVETCSVELLSDCILDSMIEMHRSTHEGKAGLLENLKKNDPSSYEKLRSKLAETEEVRGIVAPEIDKLTGKLSLAKMDALFLAVRNANFCKGAVDKAIKAIKAIEKENQKNIPQKQKNHTSRKPHRSASVLPQ